MVLAPRRNAHRFYSLRGLYSGAGGSLAFCDPDRGLAFGYVMNQMQMTMLQDPRGEALVAAAYRVLG